VAERYFQHTFASGLTLLAERMGTHTMRLDLSDHARSFLATESIAQGSGARFVALTIARHGTTPQSEAILSGRSESGNTAPVDYDGNAHTVEPSFIPT